MDKPESQRSPWLKYLGFSVFLLFFLHLTPNSTPYFSLNYFFPQLASAEEEVEKDSEDKAKEDADDEVEQVFEIQSSGKGELEAEDDDEFEAEDDDEFEAEDDDEEGEEDEEEGETEEDPNAHLYDIGPAKEQQFEQYSFPWLGNRKAAWWGAQLHILFASFILGCPMFVVIMEVMGSRRTQGVRKAIILSNVFLGILIGVVTGNNYFVFLK